MKTSITITFVLFLLTQLTTNAQTKAVNTKYGFFDYCQLAKYNGEWKIINVLWGDLPQA